MKKLFSTIGAMMFLGASMNAQVIASWSFETSQPTGTPGAGVWLTNIAPEVGSGAGSGFHAGNAVYSTPVGDGSAHSFSSTVWAVNDLYQFATTTTGVPGVKVEWDQISSSTGPGKFELQYSTDGVNFTTTVTGQYTVLVNASPNAWSSATYSSASHYGQDLSSITALDNANVWFRILDDSTTSAGGGTVASGGTGRIDNFVVEIVPEPGVFALLGFGIATLFITRRR